MALQHGSTGASRAAAEWKLKLRWLIGQILQLRSSRRRLNGPRRMAARMPRGGAEGAGERDERLEWGARGPG
jgi:hypothetical protein